MEDKLIGTTIFVDDIDLPVEEVGGHLAVPAFPPHLVRGVGHTLAVVEILPFVDVHTPVVEAPTTVEFLEVAVELLLDVFAEALKIVGVVDVACLDFVVHLIADDGRMLGEVLHHLTDDAFAVTQVGGVLEVHVLTDAVVTLLVVDGVRQHFGMLGSHPRGDGVGGCAKDDLEAGSVQLVEDAVHPCEFELSVLRFEERPGGFADTHYGKSCLFHQTDVFVKTVGGGVLAVIGSSIEGLFERLGLCSCRG